MARITLQIKNVASLILASGASVAWGVFARRFFDTPPKPFAWPFALAGTLLLAAQLFLIFVESKEEEELSLIRRQRMALTQQSIDENEKLSQRIQKEIESGDPESVRKWKALKEDKS